MTIENVIERIFSMRILDEKDLDKRKIFMSESKMNTSVFNQSQLLSNSVDITQFDNSYIGKLK